MSISRILKRLIVIILLPPLFYILAFAVRFEVFGYPVRDERHGWLGPRVRGDARCEDIGKVWYYHGDDISDYTGVFWPLCRFWIYANDL